jgi:soluble lytic murein transglycosylase-like protein
LLLLAAETGPAADKAGPATKVAAPGSGVGGGLLERARRYSPWVNDAARDARVDARLLHAVIAAESAYNPAALSAKGAVGIMQLLPGTARRYGVADAYDARQNIQGGARYLADLLRLFNNDTTLALAAYNAGEQAVLRHGGKVPPYRETVAYVPRVLGLYRHFASASL